MWFISSSHINYLERNKFIVVPQKKLTYCLSWNLEELINWMQSRREKKKKEKFLRIGKLEKKERKKIEEKPSPKPNNKCGHMFELRHTIRYFNHGCLLPYIEKHGKIYTRI